MNKLTVKHLTKSFKSKRVVKDVSMTVHQGEVVGLLGPNGAGKTTCFYMIVGLIPSDGGKVILNGQEITQYPMHVRARLGLGYLPQEASIFRKLTVRENILAVLETQKLTRSARHKKLKTLLEEFNLGAFQHAKGISLSGGERRRTEIARALACDPKFILLDEPFAGVDPISVLDIKKEIIHLRSKGIGVLITDHNVRETLDICEKATIVNQGSVIASGTSQEVLNNTEVRKVYLGEEFTL